MKKAKLFWKKFWEEDAHWWLIAHSVTLYSLIKHAVLHNSTSALIFASLIGIILIFRDLAKLFQWWGFYTTKLDKKYYDIFIKFHMWVTAAELAFALTLGAYANLWKSNSLLFDFALWTLVSIFLGIVTLRATYDYVVIRTSKNVPRL